MKFIQYIEVFKLLPVYIHNFIESAEVALCSLIFLWFFFTWPRFWSDPDYIILDPQNSQTGYGTYVLRHKFRSWFLFSELLTFLPGFSFKTLFSSYQVSKTLFLMLS